jgi:hypothetical protein
LRAIGVEGDAASDKARVQLINAIAQLKIKLATIANEL